jgi:hypothetical protein
MREVLEGWRVGVGMCWLVVGAGAVVQAVRRRVRKKMIIGFK